MSLMLQRWDWLSSSLPRKFGFGEVAGEQVVGAEKLSLTELDRTGKRM